MVLLTFLLNIQSKIENYFLFHKYFCEVLPDRIAKAPISLFGTSALCALQATLRAICSLLCLLEKFMLE